MEWVVVMWFVVVVVVVEIISPYWYYRFHYHYHYRIWSMLMMRGILSPLDVSRDSLFQKYSFQLNVMAVLEHLVLLVLVLLLIHWRRVLRFQMKTWLASV